MMSNKDELDNFYTHLREGLTVETFLRQHSDIFQFIHSQGLTKDYRLGKGRAKVLSDEITPVARFAKSRAEPTDRIRFALDNTYPDCILYHQDGRKSEIEVTLAQAQKRRHQMTELNKTGMGHGFIDVTEDAQPQTFKDTMGQEREAVTADQVINCALCDIELRAQGREGTRGIFC